MKWMESKNQDSDVWAHPWSKSQPEVPFYEDVDTHTYTLDRGWYGTRKWFTVSDFTETMTITDYSNGNGHASFYLTDPDKFSYRISLSDFNELLKIKVINKGVIESTDYKFRKSGASYLITPVL